MEPAPNPGSGSGNSGGYMSEAAETMRFQEEIQSLMRENLLDSAPENGSYFTALLGLPATQAMELLHEAETERADSSAISSFAATEIFDLRRRDLKTLAIPLGCSPTFPSNAALIERAARFSVFAAEESPASSSAPSNSGGNSPKVKAEPTDSDSTPILSFQSENQQRSGKRKEPEKNKARGAAKKSKIGGEKGISRPVEDGEKLPYVHVRARRGQATDSHSLAERARREKINARMKLLQELVPGCNKISGTALVLDEIINHVQSLQRQVEFLSMRLAAVNPRIDFSGLDSLLATENERLMLVNGGGAMGLEPSTWCLHGPVTGVRRQQQILHVDLLPSQQSLSAVRGRDDNHHGLVSTDTCPFDFHSADSVALLQSSRLKTEI